MNAGWTALATALLALAALAGCLEPIGQTASDAFGGADERTFDPPDPYRPSFVGSEGTDREEADTLAVSMRVDPHRLERSPQAELFLGDDVVIVTVENGTSGVQRAALGTTYVSPYEEFLLAGVGDTGFAGSPPTLVSLDDLGRLGDEDGDDAQPSVPPPDELAADEVYDPFGLLAELDEAPEGATISRSTTTYEGERLEQVHVTHQDGTSHLDVRVLREPGTERPVLVEGTVENGTSLGPSADVRVELAYGEEADHPYRQELRRLAATTLHDGAQLDEADLQPPSVGETRTWTVQPSADPGLVPLDELEVELRSAPDEEPAGEVERALGEGRITLPAEDGRLETEEARIVYEDADGDGHVSPGDEIRFTPTSEEAASWEVSLHDEATGMRTVPTLGPLALLGLVAALAALRRPRAREPR